MNWIEEVDFGLTQMAWNGGSWFGLTGMEEVDFGLTGMDWNGRSWFWTDWNVVIGLNLAL